MVQCLNWWSGPRADPNPPENCSGVKPRPKGGFENHRQFVAPQRGASAPFWLLNATRAGGAQMPLVAVGADL